jgi:2-polyprenyl-3-methyl-5-hydroxy-6-metoxy-1,4-benzoquinol methylase
MNEQTLDMEAVQHFAFKVVGDITAQQMGTLTNVGDTLGLFTILSTQGPLTSAEFAGQAGINERYGREWLSAMACHGYISYEDATKRFSMTPEQTFVLANPESPLYMMGALVMGKSFWANVDALATAFQHGGGVPQSSFGEHFWCGFERFTYPVYRNSLVQSWIPAMPHVMEKLQRGGAVADVGCGNGQALIILAQAFPNSTFVGYDNYPLAIEAATVNAEKAGVSDRVRFVVNDVTQGIPGTYDLITTFDVVHDMPHPRPALSAIKAALHPDGTYFVLEFNFFSDLQRNIDHPLGIGAFGYSASTNYCMTQALAVGGEGTGTCMGEERMREMATEAGFSHFRRMDFPHNPFNLFYEIRA